MRAGQSKHFAQARVWKTLRQLTKVIFMPITSYDGVQSGGEHGRPSTRRDPDLAHRCGSAMPARCADSRESPPDGAGKTASDLGTMGEAIRFALPGPTRHDP